MSKKIALLFSGQGAQAVGMGHDLAAEYPSASSLFQKADEILGFSLSNVAFNGPAEELTKTSVCQPALYVHGLALLGALKERVPGLVFHATAGLSLGEFTAHAAAGTFDFETGLRLVAKRSQAMQEACESTEGGMAAIIGGEENDIRQLAAAADVDVANLNSPGQIVLSGEAAKIALSVSLAKEYGARKAVELQVAGAFHSRLMESAYEKLSIALAETEIKQPAVPVVCNVDACTVSDADTIRRSLADQVTGSVLWTQSIEYMIDHLHITQFIELGPGGVLAGLVGRIRKGTPVISISNAASLNDAVAALSA
ncbi:malonyltransferase [Terrimicrobium sacchariphilum]|uniref:Malonyl CoA-acyl carrier protein transacylase n=1 Tax=Terrimicrobium sacchariphilum TaxID=690879 RepID=A0A146G8L7_TERSA|nr:ACP S-malonyltransferase [Terrimicrobium sacchariphilum]GAT33207.1 malonyltransferase [Terrimicrobium sacchariphilum]